MSLGSEGGVPAVMNVTPTGGTGYNNGGWSGGTIQYPLLDCDCRPVNVCAIRTRTRYAVRVETTATGGVFRMLGRGCCAPNNNLPSINGTAPTASTTPAA